MKTLLPSKELSAALWRKFPVLEILNKTGVLR